MAPAELHGIRRRPPLVDAKPGWLQAVGEAQELVAAELEHAVAGATAQVADVQQRRPVESTERADMVEVRVRRDDRHRQCRQRADDADDVAVAGSGIQQHRTPRAEDQVAVVALVVAGLADREGGRIDRLDHVVVVEPAPADRLRRCRPEQGRVPAQRVLRVQVRRAPGHGGQPASDERGDGDGDGDGSATQTTRHAATPGFRHAAPR